MAPTQTERLTGKVTWFNDAKGFGFVQPSDGGEPLHIHYSLIECEGFKTLRDGEEVEYEHIEVKQGDKARFTIRVWRLGDARVREVRKRLYYSKLYQYAGDVVEIASGPTVELEVGNDLSALRATNLILETHKQLRSIAVRWTGDDSEFVTIFNRKDGTALCSFTAV